jgi:hypothetical protein
MQHDVIALGSTFSEWADLTEEYAKGMEGLRRREPGASARMMEIAKLMSQYQQLMGSSDAPSQPAAAQSRSAAPRRTGWTQATLQMLLGVRPATGLHLTH